MFGCTPGYEEPMEILVTDAAVNSTALGRQKFGMIGRLLAYRHPRKDILLRIITNARGTATMGLVIKDVESGVYGFYFAREEDRRWVRDHKPWCFDDHPLVL